MDRRNLLYMKDGPDSSSSYYRLLQYQGAIEKATGGRTLTRVLVPEAMWRARYNLVGTSPSRLRSATVRIAYAGCAALRAFWFMIVDTIRGADSVTVVRSLAPRTFFPPLSWAYSALLRRASKVIWDYDDDILQNREIGRAEFRLLEACSDQIVLPHRGLACLLAEDARRKVTTLPTTDGDFRRMDIRLVRADRRRTFGQELRLVWVGSSAGLHDLESVADALDQAAEEVARQFGKRVRLEVVCNSPLKHDFQRLTLVNSEWSRERACEAVLSAHVGLMPLLDGPFARGKAGFKVVQYMAAGLPAIASAVGFNTEVVRHGVTGYLIQPRDQVEWKNVLVDLAADEERWRSLGEAASERWLTEFSYDRSALFWAEALK